MTVDTTRRGDLLPASARPPEPARASGSRPGRRRWTRCARPGSNSAARSAPSSSATPDGALRDLAWAPDADADVEPVAAQSPDGLAVLRHSAAHAMAQAVQDLFPGTLLGIGPPIEDGFYYDFLPERPFTPDDLDAIEKKMAQIIKAGQRFARRAISDDAARDELAGERFKLELIGLKSSASGEEATEVGDGGLTMYDNLDAKTGERVWTDLCRGPHLPTTRMIPAVKLMRSAAAYWRGSEKNPQLQRIYGTAWASRDDLKAYLQRLEEAAKPRPPQARRRARPVQLPRRDRLRPAGVPPQGRRAQARVMEDYVRRRHLEEGFEYVGTPHIAKEQLFYTSGHLPYYGDGLFPAVPVDGGDYRLKAMNCPMHNLIYKARGRSYRELPLRLFEFGHVYRYEKSGVVHGLTRVRGFAQDDSHSYVTPEQAPAEIEHLLRFCLGLFDDFGMSDYYLELSTRDDEHPDKFIGSDEEWSAATEVLERVAVDTGLELVPDPGGAAYYGPKISVQARDAIGRTWQLSTIQYDFNQPRGFELEYQADDGSRKQPVMIHSAKFGSIERFIGVLTEHYAGAFPAWLSPVQVVGIPITDDQVDYLQQVAVAAARARYPRRGRRLRRPHAEEDPHRAAAEGAVHADRRRDRCRGRRRVVPLPRRLAAQRHPDRRGDRGDRRHGRPPVQRLAERRDVCLTAAPRRDDAGARTSGSRPPPTSPGDPDGFGRLWTPHRMAYIKAMTSRPATARTTAARSARRRRAATRTALIVARGEHVYAVLNLYPYNSGHLMSVPYRHVADYPDLDDAETLRARAVHPAGHAGRPRGDGAARVQPRHQPGRRRRRRHRRAPAPARRAALGRRHQLHADRRPHAGAAAAARRRPPRARRRVASRSPQQSRPDR